MNARPVLSPHDARACLAVHESGHAVLAELLELPTKSVSIIRSSTSAGQHRLSCSIGRLSVWKVACWALGGPEAEARFRGAPARLGDGDYRFIRELLDLHRAPTEDVATLEDRYTAIARARVDAHARWIAIVATQLLIEKILPAQAVRDLRPESEEDEG